MKLKPEINDLSMNIKKRIIDSKCKGNEKRNISRFVALSLLSLTFVGASAQTGKVTVNLKEASVKELFSQIESQTNYRFSYRNVEVDKRPEITVSAKNVELKDVLTRELSKLGLKYTVSGNTIVIMDAKNVPDNKLMWYVIIHLTFVLSAFVMGYLDRLTRHNH